eukprot:15649-Pelagococcus_subviridis.AAC.4
MTSRNRRTARVARRTTAPRFERIPTLGSACEANTAAFDPRCRAKRSPRPLSRRGKSPRSRAPARWARTRPPATRAARDPPVLRTRPRISPSRFPTSVAGFIAPKIRNRGCRGTAAPSPRSESTTLPRADSNTPPRRSNVSAGARLISSSRIHAPSRSAATRAPSTNANTGPPPPPPHARSAVERSRSNCFHACTSASDSARRRFFPGPGGGGGGGGVVSSVVVVVLSGSFASFDVFPPPPRVLRLLFPLPPGPFAAAVFSSASAMTASASASAMTAAVDATRSSSASDASFATRSTPARNACSRCVHFLRSAYRSTRVINSRFATDGNVSSNTTRNRGRSGRHRCRAPAGRNPPRKSADSDWFDRFTTHSCAPTTRASCWTSAVFPVPVSPTSNTGSVTATAAATRSRSRIACPVLAHPPVVPPPCPLPNAAHAAVSAGRIARPTATEPRVRVLRGGRVEVPARRDGLDDPPPPGPGRQHPGEDVHGFFVRRQLDFRRQRVARGLAFAQQRQLALTRALESPRPSKEVAERERPARVRADVADVSDVDALDERGRPRGRGRGRGVVFLHRVLVGGGVASRRRRAPPLPAHPLRDVQRPEHPVRERRQLRMHPAQNLHRLVAPRRLQRDARPQPRERIRARVRRGAPAGSAAARRRRPEQLKPARGDDALASSRDVKPPLLEQRHERGEHLERREVDVFDDDPGPVRDGARQRAGPPFKLPGRRAHDVGPQQRLAVRLRVQVQRHEVVVPRQARHLLQRRGLADARGAFQEERFPAAERERDGFEVFPRAARAHHRGPSR